MPSRSHQVPTRRVIFIGVEGQSDRAFVRFLERCCERQGRNLSLKVEPAGGGSSVTVVEASGRYLSRQSSRKDFHRTLVLLDSDRIQTDKKEWNDAVAVASRYKLEIFFQSPNLEGLLFRLHPGNECRQIQASDAMRKLKSVWPEYDKQQTVHHLCGKFGLPDLMRVAGHDEHLRRLLEVLDLWDPS